MHAARGWLGGFTAAIILIGSAGSGSAQVRQLTNQTDGSINIPSINGDGRYITFDTRANINGLNPGFGDNVFLYEVPTGQFRRITDQQGWDPTISADGRWIAFSSSADYVGRNEDQSDEIFRWDRVYNRKYQVTRDRNGDGSSEHPVISGDGKRVVFESNSNISRRNPDLSDEVFLRRGSNRAISSDPEGDGGSYTPVISADGNVVAFVSSSNLTGYNPDFSQELFVYNVKKRDKNQVTIDYQGNGESWAPAISADGRYVIFMSSSNINDANPENSDALVLLDRKNGKTILNKQSDGSFIGADMPTISGDGEWIAFVTSWDITGNNPDGSYEIVLYSRTRKIFLPVTDSPVANCFSFNPKLSGDASELTFISSCNLTGQNPDRSWELYIFDNPALTLNLHSEGPMWMEVRDPNDGLINPNLNFIQRATYTSGDFDNDGTGEVKVAIPLSIEGTYTITMYAEGGAPLDAPISVDATLNGVNVTLASGVVGDLNGVPISLGNQGFQRKSSQVKPLAGDGSLLRFSARVALPPPATGPARARIVSGDSDVSFDLGLLENFIGSTTGTRVFTGSVGGFSTRMTVKPTAAGGGSVTFRARDGDLSTFAGFNDLPMTLVVQLGLHTDMHQWRFVRQANGNLVMK